MQFPKGTSSILIKRQDLTHVQVRAILQHIDYAKANYSGDAMLYAWWNKTEDYHLDAWRVHDNYGRIYMWSSYDNFSMGRFLVKLLGAETADSIWIDSWHSLYSLDIEDKYFVAAKLKAAERYEA